MQAAKFAALAAAVLVLSACATTEQAEKAMASNFVGKPADSFFARYGPPQSSFTLQNGGTVYRWRGGETTITIPAQYQAIAPMGGMETGSTKTTEHVSHPDANTTVTKSSSTSFSIGIAPPQVLVRPAEVKPVFCEAQLTVDAKGTITSIHATNDTQGAGMSLSRCAEVFDVK